MADSSALSMVEQRCPDAQSVPFPKDIVETDKKIVIKADAPGLTKDDIKARDVWLPRGGRRSSPRPKQGISYGTQGRHRAHAVVTIRTISFKLSI